MPNNIFLFTAPVNSGKTTTLMNWAAGQTRLGGILAPDLDGLRRIYTLRDRQLHEYQLTDADAAATPPDALVNICKFNFRADAFELARQALLRDSLADCEWVVADEVGKLEVKGRGLEPAITDLVRRYQSGEAQGKLLLVVREEMAEQVAEYYGLKTYGRIERAEMERWITD